MSDKVIISKGKDLSFIALLSIFIPLVIAVIVLPIIFKEPAFTNVRICDNVGKRVEAEDLDVPENGIKICGNLAYREELRVNARLYEKIKDIRDFDLQYETIQPGDFEFILYPDFDWEARVYYLKILYGRHYVLEPTKLDFTK